MTLLRQSSGRRYLRDRSAAIDARIPNPFFLQQLHSATFDAPSLRGYEAATHIPLMWMPPVFGSIKILAFGGPSIFRESQTVVPRAVSVCVARKPRSPLRRSEKRTNLTVDDPYPHDTVAISGVTTEERKGTVGVGVGARYGRATIKFGKDDAGAITSGFAGAVEVVDCASESDVRGVSRQSVRPRGP
jgi:hypothetical protein